MSRANVNDIVNDLLASRQAISSTDLAQRLGVTRQAAHRHLRGMVVDGRLVRLGGGAGTRYALPARQPASPQQEWRLQIPGLEEDRVWTEMIEPSSTVGRLTANARNVYRYAFTEILNNAIDHSGSPTVRVLLDDAERAAFEIVDDGVGIFRRIRATYGLEDDVDALAELTKGKVTSKPEHHSGEGIFFVSKAADIFEIRSFDLRWEVDNMRGDMAIGEPDRVTPGTLVRFEIERNTERTLDELFAEYSTDLAFDKTRALVRLFERGTSFVSRSEAKRLTAGLEKFREVILDFAGVESVGQGFADEVFRVWHSGHPEVALRPVNMGRGIRFLVERARADGADTR